MAEQNQNKKEKKGYLYPNNKTKPTQPDYTGVVVIDGKEWRLAGWQNKTSEGKEYLSINVSPPLTAEQQNQMKKNDEQKNNNVQASNSNNSPKNNEEDYYSDSSSNGQDFDITDDLSAILNSNDDDNPFSVDK